MCCESSVTAEGSVYGRVSLQKVGFEKLKMNFKPPTRDPVSQDSIGQYATHLHKDSPPPGVITRPNTPYSFLHPVGGNYAYKMIKYRDQEMVAFMVENRELICLTQAFELFLKDLVVSLQKVYTRLKPLDIQPVVCSGEQAHILRRLGVLAPGVYHCKMISCNEFDVLYDDCINYKRRSQTRGNRKPIHHNKIDNVIMTGSPGEDTVKSSFNFYPRYYGEPSAVINRFPHYPLATPLDPCLHMGINPAMMGHPCMSTMSATSQFAMRADNATEAPANVHMKSEYINRHSQEPPSLSYAHPIVPRYPDDASPVQGSC